MKLEVGMYVRIKNKAGWCCIGKLYNINDFREPSMKYCIDIQSDDFIFVPEDMIIKASHNIIDLIEVGDYVNDYKVCEIIEKNEISINKEKVKEKCFCVNNNYVFKLYNDEIETIVTKEQFEAMEYRLGDK